MLFATRLPKPDPLRTALCAAIRMDEARCVEERLAEAMLAPSTPSWRNTSFPARKASC